MTGNARSGVTVMVSSSPYIFIRVIHARRGLPLISIEQDPHFPALQFQRTARSDIWVAWTRWITSRTTSPSFASTVTSLKSPFLESPRQMRIFTLRAIYFPPFASSFSVKYFFNSSISKRLSNSSGSIFAFSASISTFLPLHVVRWLYWRHSGSIFG